MYRRDGENRSLHRVRNLGQRHGRAVLLREQGGSDVAVAVVDDRALRERIQVDGCRDTVAGRPDGTELGNEQEGESRADHRDSCADGHETDEIAHGAHDVTGGVLTIRGASDR